MHECHLEVRYLPHQFQLNSRIRSSNDSNALQCNRPTTCHMQCINQILYQLLFLQLHITTIIARRMRARNGPRPLEVLKSGIALLYRSKRTVHRNAVPIACNFNGQPSVQPEHCSAVYPVHLPNHQDL
uniref:Uncharacterized protein n=1 Tax=Ascaris lumbricoides TaxID=6252 RepID=A0A0M3I210_ASCLU